MSTDIQRVVHFVSSALDKSTSNNLLFKIEENGNCSLLAKGNQISIKFGFNAKVVEGGFFCVNSSLFLSAIKEFKNDVLDLLLDKDQSTGKYFLNITLKDLKIKLSAEIFKDKDIDFTLNATGGENFNLPLSDFLKASLKIIHCVSAGSERPNLSGIMIHSKDKHLNFVATDGRKLGVTKISFDGKFHIEEAILPKKLFESISNLGSLTSVESILNIQKTSNGLVLTAGPVSIATALVEGKFPNYENVIPKNNNIIVDLKTEDLILALKRVSSVASKNDNAYFELEIKENKLHIASESENNSAKDEISVSLSEDSNFALGIKVPLKSFIDLIDKINTEFCRFQLSTEQTPLIVSAINDVYESLFVIALTTY